ncbi:hypothetical protein [Streptomyces goshikiensis]|uniref:hypothetical protein n=1 Tax=Streptomyces goshikiensis TaxID=1942 RepID=UPI0036D0559A
MELHTERVEGRQVDDGLTEALEGIKSIVKLLHDKGLRSEHANTIACLTIGLSVASWVTSMKVGTGGHRPGGPVGHLHRHLASDLVRPRTGSGPLRRR